MRFRIARLNLGTRCKNCTALQELPGAVGISAFPGCGLGRRSRNVQGSAITHGSRWRGSVFCEIARSAWPAAREELNAVDVPLDESGKRREVGLGTA
jgi:hypothetical protein